MAGISTGYQETIADKVVGKEAYRQYRELVGGQKKKQTADRRKLIQATVVTSETIIELGEKRERIDAVKASREARKLEKATPAIGQVAPSGRGNTKGRKKNTPSTNPSSSLSPIFEQPAGSREKGEEGSLKEDNDWEDGDSDGSEYKGCIQVVAEGLGRLQVSGGIAGENLQHSSQNLDVHILLCRSGRVSKSRE